LRNNKYEVYYYVFLFKNLKYMNKRVIFLLFIAIFVISGCANSSANSGLAPVADKNGFKRPDFGQPDRKADINGIVKSIVGNEVVLIKFERPNRDNGAPDNNQADQGGQFNQVRVLGGSGQGGGARPSGGFTRGGGEGGFARGGTGGAAGATDAESRVIMLERIKSMSSGEETVLIPVGIQMLKMNQAADGSPTSAEASLSDILPDKMINVWLDESVTDRKIASFVLITR